MATKADAFELRSDQLSDTIQLLKQELWAMHSRVQNTNMFPPGGRGFGSSSEQHDLFVQMGEVAQAIEGLKAINSTVRAMANKARRSEDKA